MPSPVILWKPVQASLNTNLAAYDAAKAPLPADGTDITVSAVRSALTSYGIEYDQTNARLRTAIAAGDAAQVLKLIAWATTAPTGRTPATTVYALADKAARRVEQA